MGEDAAGPREEIRLACVFNGGVSLAVWMGGIAHEVNELTRPQSSYGPLLQLLRVRARADVISGTSAGGINGAALALAQANDGTDLSNLRVVWGEQGRLETLLNTPFRGDPSSLLRGEEVFLPELTRALRRLAVPWRPREVADRPIDLTVTTTLLDGVTLRQTDSAGQPLDQKRHDVHFRFVRQVDGAGGVVDDFSDPDAPAGRPAPNGRVLDALGLAARASAGFPVAFEPTLIPVDPVRETPDRPDMARYASWRGAADPGTGTHPDRSRYAVDGGLLNNTPTQHALAAIQQMQADVAVDRVMLLVIPLPSEQVTEAGATTEKPPTLLEMALGLAGSLTSTGSRNYVEDIVRHNRRATSLRGTRRDVLATAQAATGDAADALTATAADLYPHYRRLRLRRDARDLAATVPLPSGRSDETVRARLELVQTALDAAPPATTSPTATLPADLGGLATLDDGAWPWGTKPLLDVGAAALEYLARLVDSWPVADHGPVHAARRGVHDALARVRCVRLALDTAWEHSPALLRLPPDVEYWRLRLAAEAWLLRGTRDAWQLATTAASRLGLDVTDVLGPAVTALHARTRRGRCPSPPRRAGWPHGARPGAGRPRRGGGGTHPGLLGAGGRGPAAALRLPHGRVRRTLAAAPRRREQPRPAGGARGGHPPAPVAARRLLDHRRRAAHGEHQPGPLPAGLGGDRQRLRHLLHDGAGQARRGLPRPVQRVPQAVVADERLDVGAPRRSDGAPADPAVPAARAARGHRPPPRPAPRRRRPAAGDGVGRGSRGGAPA